MRDLMGGVISPIFKGMWGDLSSPPRNFTQLTRALGTYWRIENTLNLQSGDTFEFDFLAPTAITTAGEYLFGGDVFADRGYLLLNTSGNFQLSLVNIGAMELDGAAVALTSAYPLDGKLHTVKVTFTASAKVKKLGARFTYLLNYSGIIANPIATISGQTQIWTLGNDVGNDTEYSSGNTLTALDSIPTPSGLWVDNADGTYTGSGGWLIMPSYSSELVELTFNVVSGKTRIANGNTYISPDLEVGFHRVFTTTNNLLRFNGRSGGTVGDIHVKEVSGNAITRVNVPDVSIEQFQLSADETQWDNISPTPHQLQPVIEVSP
jgi:hypothetical protein